MLAELKSAIYLPCQKTRNKINNVNEMSATDAVLIPGTFLRRLRRNFISFAIEVCSDGRHCHNNSCQENHCK